MPEKKINYKIKSTRKKDLDHFVIVCDLVKNLKSSLKNNLNSQ